MNNKILNYRSLNSDLAILILRLTFGGLFVYHGYSKVIAFNDILPHFEDIIGIGPKLSFILLIFAELVCGFLVAIGLFTRLAVVPIFIAMVVAYFIAHAKHGFNEKELAFIFLVLCVAVFVAGSGKYSVDKLIQKDRRYIP